MSKNILHVADGFWNLRGSYKIAGLVDVGTQASLVRRSTGTFIFLDSWTLSRSQAREVEAITGGPENIEAILNLHPFHTVHVKAMHTMFPAARLYGTARHLERFPDLPWEASGTEDTALHKMYASDFEFSVPRGVDFISHNQNVHFSSVLAYHRASDTLHVDDTLMYLRLPALLGFFGLKNSISFHPTLAKALEKRPGAAQEFRDWAEQMIERWRGMRNLCAAHTAAWLAADNSNDQAGDPEPSLHELLLKALDSCAKTLDAHEKKYG